MSTRILSKADIVAIVAHVGRDALMDEIIAALEHALREYDSRVVEVRKRDGFNYDRRRGAAQFSGMAPELAGGLLEWMPVMEFGKTATIKTVSYNPQNPNRHGIPTILATICQYDIKTGRLLAACDGVLLTALRTGAASAIATRILAHPDARTVGVIGTGAQAVTQVHALSRVMKIDRVLGFDSDPEAARSFPARIEFLGLDVRVSPLSALEAAADVLVTATSVAVGKGPVFSGRALRPHLHINAIGADVPGKFECPREVVDSALVCPDFRAQAIVEGECQHLPEEAIGPTLAQLAKRPDDFAMYRDRLTIFDSTGFALQDKVALEVVMRNADRLGLGSELALEAIPRDPLDPYSIDSAIDAAAAVKSAGSK